MEFNEIGDVGAKALAEALKTNATLLILDLLRNNIEDEGAKAFGEGLKTNNTL
jgi:NLR family CARD domain-containing protein 3